MKKDLFSKMEIVKVLTNNTWLFDPLLQYNLDHINHHAVCTTDDNECMKHPSVCPKFAKCHNLYGSYGCECNVGFTMNDQDQCTGKSRWER